MRLDQSTIDETIAMVDVSTTQYLKEALAEPAFAAASRDLRDGYARGFRDATRMIITAYAERLK